MTSVKPLKRENIRSNLYQKRETRNTYEQHQQTASTEHQIPDKMFEYFVVIRMKKAECFEYRLLLNTRSLL